MPTQALTLALAGSVYPPALAAVIAIGRGPGMRPRLLSFVLAALVTTYAVGLAMLILLVDLGITGVHHRTPSAALQLAVGLAVLALAVYVRARPVKPSDPARRSKLDRYLESSRLAFVLGVTLYLLPSPQYIGAVKSVADANLGKGSQLIALAVMVAVMLWMIELPMLMLLMAPERGTRILEGMNGWFAGRGRAIVVLGLVLVGCYLAANGLIHLLG
jgi:hypothetical protein